MKNRQKTNKVKIETNLCKLNDKEISNLQEIVGNWLSIQVKNIKNSLTIDVRTGKS